MSCYSVVIVYEDDMSSFLARSSFFSLLLAILCLKSFPCVGWLRTWLWASLARYMYVHYVLSTWLMQIPAVNGKCFAFIHKNTVPYTTCAVYLKDSSARFLASVIRLRFLCYNDDDFLSLRIYSKFFISAVGYSCEYKYVEIFQNNFLIQ
jgi:hypothetical protein